VAPAAEKDGWFSSLARKVGIGGGAATDATASTPAKPKVIEAKRPEVAAPKAAAPKPDAKHAAANHRPPLKPSVDTAPPAAKDNLVSGSAPIVSTNSFDSRFGAAR
jgi:hypothetical protein